jgi:Ca2+-binding RTX toxin-like protein
MSHRGTRLIGTWALLAIGVAALAFGLSGLGRASAREMEAKASGAMRIAGSNANGAILTASSLAPGESIAGTVTIRDAGSRPAALKLSPTNLQQGGAAAPLAPSLMLTVRDISKGSSAIVYSGPLAGLGTIRAGALAPKEKRRYSFEAKLPETGLVDNALAGAWARVDFRWTLTGAASAACATRLNGDNGPNRIVGTVGGDRIDGGGGADRLFGGDGDDCIDGGPGADRISGGNGNDKINARDGVADVVDCGPGKDVAQVDKVDKVRNCETVH